MTLSVLLLCVSRKKVEVVRGGFSSKGGAITLGGDSAEGQGASIEETLRQ